MARYFKNTGGTHRRANGSVIQGGAVCRLVPGPEVRSGEQVSYREVDAEPRRWIEVKDYRPAEAPQGQAPPTMVTQTPPPAPVSTPPADAPPPPADAPLADTPTSEPPADAPPAPPSDVIDLTPFAKGGGWYDIPEVGMVKGKDNALAAMKNRQQEANAAQG